MSRVKVVLRADVPNLGSTGDVATVAGGYARNFLIPRGLASPATRGAIRETEALRAVRAGRDQREVSAAQAIKAKLESGPLSVSVQAGEDGRLFGSITAMQIAEMAEKVHGVKVNRHDVVLDAPIRHLGFHEVRVKLHSEVSATVIIEAVDSA